MDMTPFLKWRAAIPPAALEPDSLNPHFKSEYVSLQKALGVARTLNEETGYTIQQHTTMKDGICLLLTELVDPKGERMVLSEYPMPPWDNIHKYGACLTYIRRTQLLMVLGTAAEKDDDGNAGMPAAQKQSEGGW